MNKTIITLLAALTLAATACSNDDEPAIPSDALSLNMTVGDSQSTVGKTDVYITETRNFTSAHCEIASLGSKGGFSGTPALAQTAREVAVEPGVYYQIFASADIRTVAGAPAIALNASYYNVYVDSWLTDGNADITGAKVTFAEIHPDAGPLPVWDSRADLTLKYANSNADAETATYTLPKGCSVDPDIALAAVPGYPDLSSHLQITVDDRTITFTNAAWSPSARATVTLLLRSTTTYTRLHLTLLSSQ